jgi:hypothetical protein
MARLPHRCLSMGCTHGTRRKEDLCGRCWKLVSDEAKIVLDDIVTQWREEKDADGDLVDFLTWCWREAFWLAEKEARYRRFGQELPG